MRHAYTILLALLLWLPSESALAVRCGSAIVVEGDYSYRVRKKCGEPDSIDRSVIYKTRPVHRHHYYLGREDFSIVVEEWTYNLGPNQFIRVLTFENGVLKKIETAGYGFRE